MQQSSWYQSVGSFVTAAADVNNTQQIFWLRSVKYIFTIVLLILLIEICPPAFFCMMLSVDTQLHYVGENLATVFALTLTTVA